jgi:hypothetical protein
VKIAPKTFPDEAWRQAGMRSGYACLHYTAKAGSGFDLAWGDHFAMGEKNVVFVFDRTGFFHWKSHEQRVGTGECLWVGKMTAPERIASDLLLHR